MTIQDALQADRAEDYQLAATRYEELLASGDAAPEVFVNLAVLYWQVTDPGLSAAMRFPTEFWSRAGHRCDELLAEAEQRFPACTEARFWKRYIAWVVLGEPLEVDWCRKLRDEDPSSLVPAMYLFMQSNGKKSQRAALELLRLCHVDGTTRSRYIASVLESVIVRAINR